MNIQQIWKEEFEKRDNGLRGAIALQNPATHWMKITLEVPALDNRKDGLGYMKYSEHRAFFSESHEQAAEAAINS